MKNKFHKFNCELIKYKLKCISILKLNFAQHVGNDSNIFYNFS